MTRPLAKVFRLLADHPLVGVWVVAEAASHIEFTVGAAARSFTVVARDPGDGEQYVVTSVRWDGLALAFDLFVPSNGTRCRHRFRVNGDGTLEDSFTASYVDLLVRRAPPPAVLPTM